MSITRTLLAANWSTVDATSYQTDSFTPQPGKLYLLALYSNPVGTPTEPVVTGAGMSWSIVDRTPTLNNVRYSAIYMAIPGAGAAAGALTVNFNGITHSNYAWFIFEVNGADLTNPIVQSVQARPTGTTSISVPFGAPVDPANATLAITGSAVNQDIVAGAGWIEGTQFRMTSPANACQTEFADSAQQAVTCSWATSTNGFVVGVEIKAAPTAPTIRGVYGLTAQSNAIPINVTGVVVKQDDVVVVVALTSDYLRRINAPPTGLTGAEFVEEGGVYGQVNYASAYSWTAKATQDETVTIQAVPSGGNPGADFVVMRVYVFQNAEGAGDTIAGGGWASAKGSGAPSLTQTNVADNSIVLFAAVDWNARTGTVTYTSNGGAGAPTVDLTSQASAAGYYFAEYLAAGAKGSKTVGMSAPSTQKWSAISIEIVGKGLGPQVPRRSSTLYLDAVSDFEIIPPPATESIMPISASGGMSVGGSVSRSLVLAAGAAGGLGIGAVRSASAVLAMRATPAASAAAVRSQVASLAFAAGSSMAPQTSPQSSLLLAGTGGLVVAGSEDRNAVVAAVAVSAATWGALRQQAAVWAAAGSSGAAFGNMRGLLGVLAVRATPALVPNTGWAATFAPRGTPTLTIASRQSFLRVLAMGATSGVVLFVTTFEQPHYSKRVIAVVLDSGQRLALLDPVGGTAELVPAAGLAELLGAGH